MTDQEKISARQILRKMSQDIGRLERMCIDEVPAVIVLRQVRKLLDRCERTLT
jgi:hypothetical protein